MNNSADNATFDLEILLQMSGGEKYQIFPSREKFHTVVIKGVRNISEAL